MKLNEVYQSGAEIAQGTIKCTFAELYKQDGTKLYSLNKDQLGYNVLVLTNSQPDEKGLVEVALTDIASQAVLNSVDEVDPSQIVLVKENAVTWAALDESNLPSSTKEKKQSKTMLYIGLGLIALSLFKK